MKKTLSILTTAAVLAATLTGCGLSEEEYQKQITELAIDYLSAIEDANDIFADLDINDQDELFDELEDNKKDVEESIETAKECLEKIQEIKAPKEMQDFHEDLISALEKSQSAGEKLITVCKAEDMDELESAIEKMTSAAEKADKALVKLKDDDDYEWFTDEIEDEFGDDFFEE